MLKFRRALIGVAVLAAAGLAAPGAMAQGDYPSRPIVLVNPYAVGGSADLLGRALAKELGDLLGQSVIVENKAGGGASIGAAFVAKAAPDGYTLLLGTAAAHTVTPLATKVAYHGVDDFEFIGMVANVPNVLTVHPSVPAKTLKEFIALAKSEPGKLSYASAGMGSSPHIGAETFKHAAGVELLHVPYKGAAPAVNDMVAYGAMTAILQAGFSIPRDYSVCGFDNIFSSQFPQILLTTVEHFMREKGHNAMNILDERIRSGGVPAESITRVEYQPRLIVRKSTAKPRAL